MKECRRHSEDCGRDWENVKDTQKHRKPSGSQVEAQGSQKSERGTPEECRSEGSGCG